MARSLSYFNKKRIATLNFNIFKALKGGIVMLALSRKVSFNNRLYR